MALQKRSILNRLVTEVPEGLPVTSAWLGARLGASRQLVHGYVRNQWLENPCRGIYVRNLDKLSWQTALVGVQQVAGLSCYPGGVTALQLLGYPQYLPLGSGSEVVLGGADIPPSWLERLGLPVSFRALGRRLFATPDTGLVEYPVPELGETLRISSATRGMLELLAEVVDEASFTVAYELFEGMTSLNPSEVRSILLDCTHIKAKRLFLLMTNKVGVAWGRKLEDGQFELGSGKREVVPGGRLNRRFGVTVPEGFHD